MKNRPTARDFVDAFKSKNIKPVQGRFYDDVSDGKYVCINSCGCAITAFMVGKPATVTDSGTNMLLADFERETGLAPWAFVGGFDGKSTPDEDADLGREVLELLKAEGIEVLS